MDKQLFHYKGIKTHMFIVGIITVCQAIVIIFQALLSFPIFSALLVYLLLDISFNG